MWFLYSHYDQTHTFFDNREEALAEYRKWRDDFKKDLKECLDVHGDYDDLVTEMIILSKVIHRIDFDDDSKDGYKIIK